MIGDAKTMNNVAKLIGEARGKQYFDKFRKIMADFSAEERGLMEGRQASCDSTVNFTYSLVGICIGLNLLIGNGIANPIRRMTNVMDELAGGDHQVEVCDGGSCSSVQREYGRKRTGGFGTKGS